MISRELLPFFLGFVFTYVVFSFVGLCFVKVVLHDGEGVRTQRTCHGGLNGLKKPPFSLPPVFFLCLIFLTIFFLALLNNAW